MLLIFFNIILSVADIERAERALKRALIKRDISISQMQILYDLALKVEQNIKLSAIFCVRKKDTIMTNFRLDQDDIVNQLIILERDVEFSRLQ